ncbi:MAG: hypothetical protein AABY22_29065 [Nanoarchaeota archaeon]
MSVLLTFEEILKLKSRDKIPIKCDVCDKITYQDKHCLIRTSFKHPKAKQIIENTHRHCSNTCRGIYENKKREVKCKQCGTTFIKINANCIDSPNHFCNHSCAAIYHNQHKTKGFRRSKLELYLEKELLEIYPNIKFLFNNRKELGYELDIYIPELKLAFELNGIFHYEPIYGQEKLNKVNFNDKQKFGLCQQKLISLCVIDTTSLKYFKEEKAKKFLDIVINIINEKLVAGASLQIHF